VRNYETGNLEVSHLCTKCKRKTAPGADKMADKAISKSDKVAESLKLSFLSNGNLYAIIREDNTVYESVKDCIAKMVPGVFGNARNIELSKLHYACRAKALYAGYFFIKYHDGIKQHIEDVDGNVIGFNKKEVSEKLRCSVATVTRSLEGYKVKTIPELKWVEEYD